MSDPARQTTGRRWGSFALLMVLSIVLYASHPLAPDGSAAERFLVYMAGVVSGLACREVVA